MESDEAKKLRELHLSHIQGTTRRAPVNFERILVARLATVAVSGIQANWENFMADRVYISTKALKHIFDKRQAQEYDAVLENIRDIIKRPDVILENLDDKRGKLALVKSYQVTDYQGNESRETFFCSLEATMDELDVVTAFRFKDERREVNYLKRYKLLWRWEDGGPPS